MDWGDIGVLVGAALVVVGGWVGKAYGPRVEKKFLLIAIPSVTVLTVLVAVYWTVVRGDEGSPCKRLAETAQAFSTLLNESDFGAAEFQEEFGFFLVAHSDAPAEIRDDLQVLDDALGKYMDALGGEWDPMDQDLQKQLTAEIDLQRVTQASQNIAAWAQTGCA